MRLAREIAFVIACAGCAARPPVAPPATPAEAKAKGAPSEDKTAPAHTTGDCVPAPAPADDDNDEHTTLDDGFEAPVDPGAKSAPLPFAELSDEDIATKLRANIGALGPMSIGRAHGGVLVAGMQMPSGANWELVSPSLSWGTKETVEGLAHAIDAVAAKFPETPKAFIGNLSAQRGGHLPPHVSHQSGRDVDLGYYYTQGHRWYAPATAANLDKPRTWHLVRTLLADSDIDLILVDIRLQKLLKAYALEIGEDRAWLDEVFQVGGKSRRPTIFHAHGHATHLHVRFYSPAAQELGRRAYRTLLARHVIAPPTLYLTHTTKPGETLSHLAHRYKVTTDAIKKANGLTSDVLKVNRPYKIPHVGGVPVPERIAVPPRRVPPTPSAVASAKPGWDGEPCKRTM